MPERFKLNGMTLHELREWWGLVAPPKPDPPPLPVALRKPKIKRKRSRKPNIPKPKKPPHPAVCVRPSQCLRWLCGFNHCMQLCAIDGYVSQLPFSVGARGHDG